MLTGSLPTGRLPAASRPPPGRQPTPSANAVSQCRQPGCQPSTAPSTFLSPRRRRVLASLLHVYNSWLHSACDLLPVNYSKVLVSSKGNGDLIRPPFFFVLCVLSIVLMDRRRSIFSPIVTLHSYGHIFDFQLIFSTLILKILYSNYTT